MFHYNFETTSQFLSKFCIPLQCNQTIHSLLKRRDVQELGSKFVKFLMGILKQQVNSPSNFAPFLIVRTHESPVKIKLIHFLFWIKGSHQNLKFEIFKCSGKHLSYSSSHFPNHESVFLQTFHHSSVSWKITSQHCFRSNVIYFAQKKPVKVEILRTSSFQIKVHQTFVIFETNQFFFKFCTSPQCHET